MVTPQACACLPLARSVFCAGQGCCSSFFGRPRSYTITCACLHDLCVAVLVQHIARVEVSATHRSRKSHQLEGTAALPLYRGQLGGLLSRLLGGALCASHRLETGSTVHAGRSACTRQSSQLHAQQLLLRQCPPSTLTTTACDHGPAAEPGCRLYSINHSVASRSHGGTVLLTPSVPDLRCDRVKGADSCYQPSSSRWRVGLHA